MIEEYKRRYPRKVKKMEEAILRAKPKLNKKTLKRLVDREILPPVLERPELDSSWGGKDVLPLSQVDESQIIKKLA
jgi:hypothetical protein